MPQYSFPQQSSGTNFLKMTSNVAKVQGNVTSIAANSYSSDLISISNPVGGIVTDLKAYTLSGVLGLAIVVDGVTLDLFTDVGTAPEGIFMVGHTAVTTYTSIKSAIQELNGPIPFKSTFAVKLYNCNTTADANARNITVHYLLN